MQLLSNVHHILTRNFNPTLNSSRLFAEFIKVLAEQRHIDSNTSFISANYFQISGRLARASACGQTWVCVHACQRVRLRKDLPPTGPPPVPCVSATVPHMGPHMSTLVVWSSTRGHPLSNWFDFVVGHWKSRASTTPGWTTNAHLAEKWC